MTQANMTLVLGVAGLFAALMAVRLAIALLLPGTHVLNRSLDGRREKGAGAEGGGWFGGDSSDGGGCGGEGGD